jgi:glutathione S-transferase
MYSILYSSLTLAFETCFVQDFFCVIRNDKLKSKAYSHFFGIRQIIMTLTFYFAPNSTANITEAVLAELQVPVNRVQVDLKDKKPDFVAVNPNGRVPTIVHDGVSIWESAAITLYLGETFGVEKKLFPGPGTKRGEAMKWVVWSNVSLASATMGLFGSTAGSDGHNKAVSQVLDLLKILDEVLQKNAFILGSEYSLVDTHLHSIVAWIKMMKVDTQHLAGVEKWYGQCEKRPVAQK